jgi:dihydrofolate reductase
MTLVECEPQADTWFPEWNKNEWREISRRSQPVDENNALAYEVVILERVSEICRAPGKETGLRV